MRTLVAFEHMTLDGYASSGQDLGFEFTFRAYDDELQAYAEHIQADFDTAIYGRETYLGMFGHWSQQPNAESSPGERRHAEWVNAVDKIVCSTTLESAEWNNTRLISSDVAAQIEALKREEGGVIAIYASPKLVHSFIDMGLVDEFRIVVHPVTLGSGIPVFHDKAKLDLDLLESKAFGSGAVYLRYQVR
ncbi:dihydrofolate reductase family protein [Nocardia mikamii]|uniref:dihydrofolate reductase family protein n=1 Tax=Nocardia mikamii TaxID=508464 RepID=UPI0007A37731|nr:dihydrofolate reductase family protein [Nocardia mikamii]